MVRNPYSPPQTPVADASGQQVERPASPLRKVIVSILWIALLNGVFIQSYVAYVMTLDPPVTTAQPYEFGATYGFYFFVSSVAVVVFLAVANKLPGAKRRVSNGVPAA